MIGLHFVLAVHFRISTAASGPGNDNSAETQYKRAGRHRHNLRPQHDIGEIDINVGTVATEVIGTSARPPLAIEF
jgi:hypothetical protein